MLSAEHIAALAAPFPAESIELKPGALTKDKSKALALPYVDIRAYQRRLDAVVGPANWSVAYRPLGESAIICTLTIFGITKEDVGEADANDPNRATAALAQAFKRACSAFGLGRYLYDISAIWADYDKDRQKIINPEGVVRRLCPEIRPNTTAAPPPPPASPVRAPRETVVHCRGCNAPIAWKRLPSGKNMPYNVDANNIRTDEPHWATCPQAAHFRAGRMADDVFED